MLEIRPMKVLPMLSLMAVVACPGIIRAQQPIAAKTDAVPAPVTTADPNIPKEQLEVLVRPLTKEELVVEANGWRNLLKATLQEFGQQQIAAQALASKASEESSAPDEETTGEEKKKFGKSLGKLREDQSKIIQRINIVLDSLETKGGDVEAYRMYIAAVSGVKLDVGDAATAWTVFRAWLTSEEGGIRWAWNLGKFLSTLVAFYFAASIVARLVRRGASKIKNVSKLLVDFLGKFVKQIMLVLGLLVALSALEVNIGPLLAAVGAAGFVVGFALQDTLSNFASGLLILAYRPFDVGDAIEASGVSGSVDSVSLFSTHVRTFDNKVMIIPNNDIWGGTITNATASDTRRVDLVFGIGYDDDVEQAKSILERIVTQHDLVLKDPAPVVQLHELADSSLNFICRPWSKTADYWTVYWDVTQAAKKEFDLAGISIPFPQRDVHVYQHAIPETSGS